MMKTRILGIFLALASLSMYAQKDELKAAEKAIKDQDFNTAVSSIDAAESFMSAMDTRTKAKFYYLKAQAYAGKKDFETATTAFENLLAEEKQSGKKKYSADAEQRMNIMLQEVNKKANDYYKSNDYGKASKLFYLTYKLSPTDTIFVYNAAIASTLAKEYDQAMAYYQELQDMKYTGVTTQYWATNKTTKAKENLGSKNNRDLFVKAGEYIDPFEKQTESKVGDIAKNIALILREQGKVDEAIKAMEKARNLFPNDVNLILAEADLYFRLKKMDKYASLMEQAIKQDPTNHLLFFNLGVISFDQKKVEDAKNYYKKAIEIKPDYADAYFNLAVAILDQEKAIVEEMNKNLSDFDKYDQLLVKQKAVYKEALPYLEKADELARSLSTVQTLMNFYETLAMTEKSKKFRALYEKMKQ